MKVIAAMAATLALAGCGALSRAKAVWTGSAIVCVSGVSYVQFPSGATPQVDKGGNPVPCK